MCVCVPLYVMDSNVQFVVVRPYQIDFLLLGLQIRKSDQGGR